MNIARANERRRWWELRLVSVLAVLAMVGAWSAAQRHELVPATPAGAVTGLGGNFGGLEAAQFGFRISSLNLGSATAGGGSSSTAVDIELEGFGLDEGGGEAAGSGAGGSEVAPLSSGSIRGTLPAISGSGSVVNFLAATPLAGAINYYEYAWPTEGAGWNLLAGLVLAVGTGFVVESLARRRGRVALWEMLLAITVAGMGLAIGRQYWSESGLAERALLVQGVLVAGYFFVLLTVAWGVAVSVMRGVRRLRTLAG